MATIVKRRQTWHGKRDGPAAKERRRCEVHEDGSLSGRDIVLSPWFVLQELRLVPLVPLQALPPQHEINAVRRQSMLLGGGWLLLLLPLMLQTSECISSSTRLCPLDVRQPALKFLFGLWTCWGRTRCSAWRNTGGLHRVTLCIYRFIVGFLGGINQHATTSRRGTPMKHTPLVLLLALFAAAVAAESGPTVIVEAGGRLRVASGHLLDIGLPPPSPPPPSTPSPAVPPPPAVTDCYTLKQLQPTAPSGVYSVLPRGGGEPQQVYCEMTVAGGGWTAMAYLRNKTHWSWGPGDGTDDGVVGDVANGWNSAKTLLELDQDVNDRLIFYKALWEDPNAQDATEEAWGLSRTYDAATYLGISTCSGPSSRIGGAGAVRRLSLKPGRLPRRLTLSLLPHSLLPIGNALAGQVEL